MATLDHIADSAVWSKMIWTTAEKSKIESTYQVAKKVKPASVRSLPKTCRVEKVKRKTTARLDETMFATTGSVPNHVKSA